MPFRVTARTLLQLGAELISSDAIAFYELIKNAFDANSTRVRINFIMRIASDDYFELHDLVLSAREKSLKSQTEATQDNYIPTIDVVRVEVLSRIESTHFKSNTLAEQAFNEEVKKIRQQISEVNSWDGLLEALEEANYIDFADTGEGMTLDDLKDVYLTIGTRSRLKQRERVPIVSTKTAFRPILGEKGLGRLSVMRLGEKLCVKTSRKGEQRFNLLEIDWRLFSHDSDALLEDIVISPHLGIKKTDPDASGTTVRISSLQSAWSKKRLEDVARQQINRLSDPFSSTARFPVIMRFNGQIINIPPFNNLILEAAHATVDADFTMTKVDMPLTTLTDDYNSLESNPITTDGQETILNTIEPRLSTRIDYLLRNRQKTILLEGAHLCSSVGSTMQSLVALGPFRMKLYWYNRRILTEIDGIGTRQQVSDLIADWGGGLMLFRDGFRVFPYGSGDDDWLDLDRSALGANGYKVNRRQIIGKVDITTQANPKLVDQTNREGLRDNEQKQALRALLFYILTSQFRTFLDDIDEEIRALEPVTLQEVGERVEFQKKEVQKSLYLLKRDIQGSPAQESLVKEIENAVNELGRVMEEVKSIAESYEKGKAQMVHLAGIGLMIESIAHELHRATSYTLNTIAANAPKNLPPNIEQFLVTLEAQMKTLQTRLRVLDPLETNARQRKTTFDLVDWVRQIVNNHKEQFARHEIRGEFKIESPGDQQNLYVKAVKGMVVQILENLIGNSVYWADQQKILMPDFRPKITITVRIDSKQILCTDNGPGIPLEQREDVFKPFYTTKPPGNGRGLGLFISREIAAYHNATLELSPEPTAHTHRLNTFIISLEK